jgi:hypothetical protein
VLFVSRYSMPRTCLLGVFSNLVATSQNLIITARSLLKTEPTYASHFHSCQVENDHPLGSNSASRISATCLNHRFSFTSINL